MLQTAQTNTNLSTLMRCTLRKFRITKRMNIFAALKHKFFLTQPNLIYQATKGRLIKETVFQVYCKNTEEKTLRPNCQSYLHSTADLSLNLVLLRTSNNLIIHTIQKE